MDLFTQKTEFEKTDGPVRYLDGSSLKRPFSVPWTFRLIMALFVGVAVIVGGIFLFNVNDTINNAPMREVEATQKNLVREVTLDLPALKDLIQLDDTTILAQFSEAGLTTYSLGSTEMVEGSGFDIVKLPSDVSVAEAGIMYASGISSLSSADASKLLNGSWRMVVTRTGSTNMSIKYADFSSGSVEAAVQNTIVAEGLADTTLGESGVDSVGNTFQKGQVDVNGTVYNWQVAACPLSDVYSVDGLPSNAAYVGIRIY